VSSDTSDFGSRCFMVDRPALCFWLGTFFASGFGKLAHLGVNTLAVRGYPGVAVFHALLMTATYAKEKAFSIARHLATDKPMIYYGVDSPWR
jgi:hypothetical protein